MIVIKEKERLYLDGWSYNSARLLSRLAQIVTDRGGAVKPLHSAVISARNSSEEKEPITATHTTYITFALDDVYYYYQTDRNPLFPFYYQKTPIRDGKRSRSVYLTESRKSWWDDNFFSADRITDADIIEGANLILNELTNAPHSQIYREKRRERVANTYSSGYHYETIYAPERLETIDF